MKAMRVFAFLSGLAAAVLLFGWPVADATAASHDPGYCIRCEAYGNVDTCKRCLDKPDSTKATVPAACKAAVPECKARVEGECKPLGNPQVYLSCLNEDKKCAAAVAKCEAWK